MLTLQFTSCGYTIETERFNVCGLAPLTSIVSASL